MKAPIWKKNETWGCHWVLVTKYCLDVVRTREVEMAAGEGALPARHALWAESSLVTLRMGTGGPPGWVLCHSHSPLPAWCKFGGQSETLFIYTTNLRFLRQGFPGRFSRLPTCLCQ